MERVTTADLMEDLPKVVHDTQALLRATECENAEEAHRRVQAALDTARTRLKAMQGLATEMGEEAVRATETNVRDNPGTRSASRRPLDCCWPAALASLSDESFP